MFAFQPYLFCRLHRAKWKSVALPWQLRIDGSLSALDTRYLFFFELNTMNALILLFSEDSGPNSC
jgi:hypothetical protein